MMKLQQMLLVMLQQTSLTKLQQMLLVMLQQTSLMIAADAACNVTADFIDEVAADD
jgi:hypothetical protein